MFALLVAHSDIGDFVPVRAARRARAATGHAAVAPGSTMNSRRRQSGTTNSRRPMPDVIASRYLERF